MSFFRLHSLRWASGFLCAILGALALVAPHQFDILREYIGGGERLVWGLIFLAAGLALMGVSVSQPPRWLSGVFELFAGGLLLALGLGMAAAGGRISASQYLFIGFSLSIMALIRLLSEVFHSPIAAWLDAGPSKKISSSSWPPDLFSLIFGLIALLTGISCLALPQTVRGLLYNLPTSLEAPFLIALAASGALLAASHLWAAWRGVPAAGPDSPRLLTAATRVGHLVAGGIHLSLALLAPYPGQFWIAAAYSAGLGLMIILLPWLGPRLQWVDRTSLYSRMALILSITAGLPLVLTVSLVSAREEAAVRAGVMAGLESRSAALAQNVNVYFHLHRSALRSLASHEELVNLPQEDQVDLLEDYLQAYPDLSSISLFDPQGMLLTWVGPQEPRGPEFYAALEEAGQTSIVVMPTQLEDGTVFGLSELVLNSAGSPAGMLVFELPAERVEHQLMEDIEEPGSLAYLVDGSGRILLYRARNGIDALSPLLGLFRQSKDEHRSLAYHTPAGEHLGAFSRLSDQDWAVLLEQPAVHALSEVYKGRDLAFGVLLVSLVAAVSGSMFLTWRQNRLFAALSQAARRLAAGDDTAPLPRTGFSEFLQLAAVFGEMRVSLARRTHEREQALRSVRSSEALLRQVLEALPVGVWILDNQGKIIEANSAGKQVWVGAPFTGFEGDGEYRGRRRTTGELIQPEDWAGARALRLGVSTLDEEVEIECQDGTRKVILSSAIPLRTESGMLQGAIIVNQDISSRVRAEEALQDAYRELEAANKELSTINARLEEANRELETRVEERTADLQRANERLEAVNAELQEANDELARAKLDLEWDLAERERITDRLSEVITTLEERERQLRTILEALPVGVWLTDARGSITYANPAAQRIWSGAGVKISKLDMLVGKRMDGDQQFDLQMGEISRALQTREAVLNETIDIKCQDGNYKIIRSSAVPILDENENPMGVVVVNEDITDQSRAEEALRSYAERLERSNQDLEHFAFIASHDLQEPLRKVRSFGDLLKSEYSHLLGDRGRDFIFRMQDAAGRMQSMISDLLAYSRVSTHTSPFSRVDLCEVAREVITDLESLIERTGGKVELDQLPSVEADPAQMRQLLMNLLVNALKFHHKDTVPVVRVYGMEAEDGGKTVKFCVEDNGIGFDLQYLDRIFQPFQRLHGRSEYEGSGIGLAICRKIVERHGGSISASSTPGQGSTFTVTLPVGSGD